MFPGNTGAGVSYCTSNPTFCQIIKNKPSINRAYAKSLATSIDKYAFIYGLRSEKLTAIFAQESKYELTAFNRKSLDYGISQINHKTIRRFGFDKQRLLTDMDYAVRAGAIVLADFKRMYGHREQDWWTRYNSSKSELRSKYKVAVLRYM